MHSPRRSQGNVAELHISDRKFALYLCLILCLAAVLRAPGLKSIHLCYWDEGIFLMGSRFLSWRIGEFMHGVLNRFGAHYILHASDQYAGYPVYLQKPFHVILLTVTRTFLGDMPWIVNLHSLIYSLGTIFLVVWIGSKLFTRVTGLFAALWMTFQPFHIHYSRLGLHEMDSMFLSLLAFATGMWAIRSTQHRRMFLPGLCFMLAFGTSYRLLFLLFCFFAFFIFLLFFENNNPASQIRLPAFYKLLFFTLGLFSGFLFLEFAYRFAFSPEYLWSQPGSYLKLLIRKMHTGESAMDLNFPGYYIGIFQRFDGVVSTTLLMISLANLLFRRSIRSAWICIFFCVPFVIFSLTSTRLARTLTFLIPWGAIATGVLFSDIVSFYESSRFPLLKNISYLLIASFLILMFNQALPIYRIRSGYPELLRFLDHKGALRCLSTMKPVIAAYKGRAFVDDPGKTLQEMREKVNRTGVRYLCMDWQKFVRYWKAYQIIEQLGKPIAVFPNPVVDYFSTLRENYLPMDIPFLWKTDPTINQIKVYDLYQVLPELGYDIRLEQQKNQ